VAYLRKEMQHERAPDFEPGSSNVWSQPDANSLRYCGSDPPSILYHRPGSKVVGFYHVAPMHEWETIAREQLDLLMGSGLFRATSQLYASIVGETPKGSSFNFSLPEFGGYPDCKMTYLRTSDRLEFEYATLRHLHQYCAEHPEDYVYYIHSKGVRPEKGTAQYVFAKEWRTVMQYFQVELWYECLSALLCGFDTCGVNVRRNPSTHYSGNFWWATCAHVRQLRPPGPDPRFTKASLEDWRWAAEMWLLGDARVPARIKECYNDGVDHYKTHFNASALRGRRCFAF